MSFKICYIWVAEFRNLKNFGFNLSGNEKFVFDPENLKLSKSYNQIVPEDFFGENISEVTGIIGKNGTGKSNLLELICKLVKGGKTSIDSDFLIVTKTEGNYECHYRFKEYKSIDSIFQVSLKEYSGDIDDLRVIYFSNVYDERAHVFDRKITDLSANKRYSIHPRSRITSDFVKQFQFIRSELFQYSEIPTPKKIVLSPKYNVHNSNYWKQNYFSDNILNQNFNSDYSDFFKDLKALKPSKNKLYYFFIYSIIVEVLSLIKSYNKDNLFETSADFHTNILVEKIENIRNTYKSKHAIAIEWINWCYEIINGYFKEEHHTYIEINKPFIENLYKNIQLLDRFKEFIETKDLKINTEGSRGRKVENYILEFNEASIKLDESYYNFIDSFKKFTIGWQGISSGHKAYLDLFSLLHFELKNIRTSNVLICIDEGDLYLHPKWQADFFFKLITLIPKFKNANFQFVLTSHSPFLVSDLPKQNLIFLKEGNENYSSIINENDSIKTFGGNLGELYIDAFFMEGSLISRFAADKIQKIINKVNSKQKVSDDDKKVIELIGEDLIRIQINNLLDDSN